MADLIEEFDKAETIVILVLIGVGIYFLYQLSDSGGCAINQLFGLDCNPDSNKQPGGSYANAANQSITNPLGTLGSIVGIGQGSGGGQSELPSSISSVGYMKVGASGQHWSCTGPQGGPNDSCVAVSVDANGNATVSGPGGPAAQCN